MNLTPGGTMKLTGSERFPVKRGKHVVQTRLADLTGLELLELANGLQRDCDPRAGALFAYQAQRRRERAKYPAPGPQAA